MKTYLFAAALAVATAQPVNAATFPTLTTIYLGSVVRDDAGAANVGVATVFHCTNVSGVSASLRFLVLGTTGVVEADFTVPVAHGRTWTAATHNTAAYVEDTPLETGAVTEGVINIEATQSAIFCNAKTIGAANSIPIGVALPLVRVNPHPGTVE